MSYPENNEFKKIQFYLTANYNCGYISGKKAQSIVASPYQNIKQKEFDNLINIGFRRSGNHVYKPHCHECEACVPIRLNVKDFKPNKSQIRCLKKNDFEVIISDLNFNSEDFQLYQQYQSIRHHDQSTSEEDQKNEYINFLLTSNIKSQMIKFFIQDKLVMVSIVDILVDGISAVYTFYDQNMPKLGLGTYSILWLADWCKQNKLPYLYLGYWISDNARMSYKTRFKPYELLNKKEWKKFNE